MLKRLLSALGLLALGAAVYGDDMLSARQVDVLRRMFLQVGAFGFPPSATDPFSCTANTARAVYYNTTTNTSNVCNGTAWLPLGGSGTGPGQFLNVNGTLAATGGVGALFNVATGTSGSQAAVDVFLFGTYASNGGTFGIYSDNATPATGTDVFGLTANYAVVGETDAGAGHGAYVGVFGVAYPANASDIGYGVVGQASGAASAGAGVVGAASGGTLNAGGYFYLASTNPSIGVTAALIADNGAVAAPILVARDNGAAVPTTGATATTVIRDGAMLQGGNMVLTNGTMTAEKQAEYRSVVSSYTWTNAMIVALGAVNAGDITVATLPAKTVVRNAYVVIITPDSSANALTVACGRTGATYIDYTVASDAKAAANTVYGDTSGERGTNLTGYDLPSYTGTTNVVCHFIKTTTTLDTVTGSTGRVVLETALVP